MTSVASPSGDRLPAWALYGGVLAAAGLPIYIYAPKYYADSFGVSLAALGAVLFGLRLIDVVQDPVLGWLSERLAGLRGRATFVASVLMGAAMVGLFAVEPPIAPLVWFGLTLTLLFTAFSFLSISFYAQGVRKAEALAGAHVRLASWREAGALLGICIAAASPALLTGVVQAPFAVFGWAFAGVALIAAAAMAPEWGGRAGVPAPANWRAVLHDRQARWLLVLALVNAIPFAVSSTLFLFFVESRLAAPGWEGPLLVLFFLSAAASAPLWGRLARSFGPRRVLMAAMVLAIASFAGALRLGAGDAVLFAVICALSGAAVGADLTLLPALFARRLSQITRQEALGFSLWAFVNKASLAIAAAVVLPLLDRAGFVAGAPGQPQDTLRVLTWLYAGLPCALKVGAIALLTIIPMEDKT